MYEASASWLSTPAFCVGGGVAALTSMVDVAHHHRARRVRSPWLSGGGLWSENCIRTVPRSKPDVECAGNLHRGKQVSPVCPTYQAGSGCPIHERGSGCPVHEMGSGCSVASTFGTALGTKRPGHLDAAMLERPPYTKAGGSPMPERLGKALRERVWAKVLISMGRTCVHLDRAALEDSR